MNSFITQDQMHQLLQVTLGQKVEIANITIVNQQHEYLVLLVQLRHPTMHIVVKLAGPAATMASSFERTAMLHRMVATRTTIRMPEILAVNMSFQSWPWRFIIKTFIPGYDWYSVRKQLKDEELSSAYQQIGNSVAQLHTIQFSSFGELANDGCLPEDGSFLTAFIERARLSIKSMRLSDLFFSTLEKYRHLFIDIHQPSLCHEDLHGYNIIFQQRHGKWHLVTILDFEKAWAGHHEIDLARMEFWRGMTNLHFWQSYKEICTINPLYDARRPIYQLLWCFEFAQPAKQHRADTKRLCQQLGIASPVRFF